MTIEDKTLLGFVIIVLYTIVCDFAITIGVDKRVKWINDRLTALEKGTPNLKVKYE